MIKKALYNSLLGLCGIVLFGKVLNWILDFNEQINFILNALMFSLIGLLYIIAGFIWDNKFIKLIFIISGLYLVTMNFVSKNTVLTIFGIICIATPMLILRFFPKVE